MKKFNLTILVMLLVTSLVLAACQPAAQETETPAAAGETEAETPADAEGEAETPTEGETPAEGEEAPAGDGMALDDSCGTVQLTYWNPFTGPDGPYMGQMVDAFNAEHPNIQVTMNSQPDYYTQLTTAAASDTLPDVAIVHADQVATQAFRNVLRPIDDIVEQIGVSGDDFPAGIWAAGEVAGQRYSIPLDIHPMTAFYNADLFEAAGVAAAPMTAEEFTAAADAVAGTEGNYGFMITTGFPVQQIFQMLLHQYGGSEFSEDGSEATWNSEAGVQALTWMKQAQDQWSEPNLEVDAELNAFKTGAVGMVWNGIWQFTNLTGEAVEFNGMATGVPQIGPEMAVWVGSHQFTLPSHSAGPDACKDQASAIFIRYMLDNSVTWAKAGQIPASNSVRTSAEFGEVQPQATIAASVEQAFLPPAVPGITDAFGPLGEAVAAVMSGEATDIQATLDDAAQRANEILEQNRATYGDAPSGQ